MDKERERERERERAAIYFPHKVTYLQELTRSYFTSNGGGARESNFLRPRGETER